MPASVCLFCGGTMEMGQCSCCGYAAVCSVRECGRIRLAPGIWTKPVKPLWGQNLSHGFCPECYRRQIAEIIIARKLRRAIQIIPGNQKIVEPV